jgi:hypothetical protein
MSNFNAGPAFEAEAVVPADDGNLDETRGLYIGGAGDLKVDMASGDTVTFTGIAGGVVHPLRVVRVYDTGTTATNILALR